MRLARGGCAGQARRGAKQRAPRGAAAGAPHSFLHQAAREPGSPTSEGQEMCFSFTGKPIYMCACLAHPSFLIGEPYSAKSTSLRGRQTLPRWSLGSAVSRLGTASLSDFVPPVGASKPPGFREHGFSLILQNSREACPPEKWAFLHTSSEKWPSAGSG